MEGWRWPTPPPWMMQNVKPTKVTLRHSSETIIPAGAFWYDLGN